MLKNFLQNSLSIALVVCTALFTGQKANAQNCPAPNVENNGLVIIEAETGTGINSNWSKRTNIGGFTGSSYLRYVGPDSFTTPGRNTISYKFQIKTPGTYRFVWRNRIARGNNRTEHNDGWVRFPDAANFYGQRGNSRIFPRGTGKGPNPEGASRDGWFKAYTNDLGEWTYQTVTSDFDPHEIFVRFNNAGVYTVQVSGRSNGHAIDRLILFNNSNNNAQNRAFNPSTSATRCSGGGGNDNQSPTVQAGADQTLRLPNNSITLNANANDPDGSISNYSWSKLSGPSASINGANSRSLRLSSLRKGTYNFRVTVTDNDGARASDNVRVFVLEQQQSDPNPPSNGSVTLTLINTSNSRPVSGFNPIREGAKIDLSKVGRNLSIVANAPDGTSRVVFGYNGNNNFKSESLKPYAIAGDNGSNDINDWNYRTGNNRVSARVFNSNGNVIARTTVNFEILNEVNNPPSNGSVTFTLINTSNSRPIPGFNPIREGAKVDLSKVGRNLSIVANAPNGTSRVIFGYNGNNNFKTENLKPYAIAGDNGSNDIKDWNYRTGNNTVSARAFNNSGNVIVSTTVNFEIQNRVNNPQPEPRDVIFTLFNANTDRPINGFESIGNNTTINLALTGRALTIVVNTSPQAEFVQFDYNGRRNYRVEGSAPFSLTGDRGTNLLPITFPLGTNRVTARVFSNNNLIAERSISFRVVNNNARISGYDKNASAPNSEVEKTLSEQGTFSMYPNPASNVVNLYSETAAEVIVYDNTGVAVSTAQIKGGSQKLDISGLKPGVYNIQVQSVSGVQSYRLLKQ